MDNGSATSVVEALILASKEPLAARKIAGLVEGLTPSEVGHAVAALNNRYMEAGASFRIRELAGGYQFYIVPEFAGYVEELFTRQRKLRLTRPALETLAIVAYRQPVTKIDIEHIRGVASDGVLHNLLEKNLITIRGRAKTVGKPLQYGTTNEFLAFFGLASLSDLPKMSEIEELIRSREPQAQTELALRLGDNLEQKLNIADGTYTPASHDHDDGGSRVAVSVVAAQTEQVSQDDDDSEEGSELLGDPEEDDVDSLSLDEPSPHAAVSSREADDELLPDSETDELDDSEREDSRLSRPVIVDLDSTET